MDPMFAGNSWSHKYSAAGTHLPIGETIYDLVQFFAFVISVLVAAYNVRKENNEPPKPEEIKNKTESPQINIHNTPFGKELSGFFKVERLVKNQLNAENATNFLKFIFQKYPNIKKNVIAQIKDPNPKTVEVLKMVQKLLDEKKNKEVKKESTTVSVINFDDLESSTMTCAEEQLTESTIIADDTALSICVDKDYQIISIEDSPRKMHKYAAKSLASTPINSSIGSYQLDTIINSPDGISFTNSPLVGQTLPQTHRILGNLSGGAVIQNPLVFSTPVSKKVSFDSSMFSSPINNSKQKLLFSSENGSPRLD